MDQSYTFPFGQPVKTLTQQDRTPKSVFILGVYASAVHARWIGPDGRRKIAALAVASEPYIFWRGEGAEDIIADIRIPAGVGKLIPAPANMNGPSGRSLDECFLQPLGITRNEAWLCDIVPHSCMNPDQEAAIQREYAPLVTTLGLPAASVPRRPKPIPQSEARRNEILLEIQEAKPDTIVLLGDEPIDFFLRFFESKFRCLGDFGKAPDTYGRKHRINLAGKTYHVLPLTHPRNASKLGTYSQVWHELHQQWMKLRRES